MEGISKLLDESCILLDRNEHSIETVIRTLTEQLSSTHPDIAPQHLMQNVIDGGFHTTCMGEACAITHARCPSMRRTLMAAMRLDPPLDLNAIDGKKVRLVFLLVGPQSSASFHLKILSRLARLLHNEALRSDLLHAETSKAFLERIIRQED
ncbi:PTS sugar transporter subunit IIA [Sphaerochaeta halotolerans]|jgi:mannitol/fructose-specific phosphotransferase system IIA component (Ntr-type)|uniref:PTS sugar transporter subunit IIA n=1 Tax=Sphaerochaeta halotolerans TaxID=2293840 RepID=UPI001371D095|nr:PTS sugar transporter subunit IIA [Sphaerochaeta halotolerans]MXI86728.1 PTS transporter subunit EIIA [Sphaerochaeta halotolerans]